MGIRGSKTWDDIQVWKFSSGATQAGAYDATGAWTLGPSAATTISHIIQGNSSSGTLQLKADSSVATLRLERTGTGTGIVYFGSSGGDFRFGSTFGGVEMATSSSTGGWTFGNTSTTSIGHTFNSSNDPGIIVINSAAAAGIEFRRTGAGAGSGFISSSAGNINFGSTAGNNDLMQMRANAQVQVTTTNWGTGGTAVGVSSGLLTTSPSSLRYKRNVNDMIIEINSSEIFNLRPVTFDYKIDNRHSFGYIAEEVNITLPCLVNFENDDNGIPRPESVSYDHLAVLLVEELKKLKTQFDTYVIAHP